MVQIEDLLHIRDQDVIKDGHEAPHKKQKSQADKGRCIVVFGNFFIHYRLISITLI